jgi:hypothetical protein
MSVKERPASRHTVDFWVPVLGLEVQAELCQTPEVPSLELFQPNRGQTIYFCNGLWFVNADHGHSTINVRPHASGPSTTINYECMVTVQVFPIEPSSKPETTS